MNIIDQWIRTNEWMDDAWQTFSPLLTYVYKYNYNHISYLTQICWIENRTPGVGPRPPLVIPYGIPSGADTIHPALFHGSTCFKIVTDSLGSFISILFLIGWVQTFQPERVMPLAINWKTTISIRLKVRSVTCWWCETDTPVTLLGETDKDRMYLLYGMSRNSSQNEKKMSVISVITE